MLTIDTSCLLIIDVQGKLANLMQDKEILFENMCTPSAPVGQNSLIA